MLSARAAAACFGLPRDECYGLGDRDDFARTNGEGFPSYIDLSDFGPVPGRIRVRLFGEGGRIGSSVTPSRTASRAEVAPTSRAASAAMTGSWAARGQDRLEGLADRDEIDAADGVRDTVLRGPGQDTAIVDPVDRVSDCETLASS